VLQDARALGGSGGPEGEHALGSIIVPAKQQCSCMVEVEPHEGGGLRDEIEGAC